MLPSTALLDRDVLADIGTHVQLPRSRDPLVLFEQLDPAWVSPLVGYLASEACTDTGAIFSVGGGYYARVALIEGPGARIQEMRQKVPGGWLVLDHYTYTLSRLTKASPLFRLVLRRVSPARGLRWTQHLVRVFLPLHRAARRHRLAQALLSRISPVLAYYHVLPLDDHLQRQWALLDTYDALTDWYKHLRTRGQIRRILERLGAVDIWCEYGGNGVEARCRRPPA